MSIVKYLQSGHVVINQIRQCIQILETGKIIEYKDISAIDWGIIYEKYVGQIMQSLGYQVKYNMSKGFLDGGIDIIAENNNHKLFIQCKAGKYSMSKQKIEWILYKASKTLHKEWKNRSKHLCFVLVTPDKEISFKKNNSKHKDVFGNPLPYPWLTHFLNTNNSQDKIKVFYREIQFPR